MEKHTTGPWKQFKRLKFKDSDMFPFEVVAPNSAEICKIYHCITIDEAEANAKLIAAAPDMLAALKKILNTSMDTGREGCTYGDTDYDSMSAAYGYNLCLENLKEIAQNAIT